MINAQVPEIQRTRILEKTEEFPWFHGVANRALQNILHFSETSNGFALAHQQPATLQGSISLGVADHCVQNLLSYSYDFHRMSALQDISTVATMNCILIHRGLLLPMRKKPTARRKTLTADSRQILNRQSAIPLFISQRHHRINTSGSPRRDVDSAPARFSLGRSNEIWGAVFRPN